MRFSNAIRIINYSETFKITDEKLQNTLKNYPYSIFIYNFPASMDPDQHWSKVFEVISMKNYKKVTAIKNEVKEWLDCTFGSKGYVVLDGTYSNLGIILFKSSSDMALFCLTWL